MKQFVLSYDWIAELKELAPPIKAIRESRGKIIPPKIPKVHKQVRCFLHGAFRYNFHNPTIKPFVIARYNCNLSTGESFHITTTLSNPGWRLHGSLDISVCASTDCPIYDTLAENCLASYSTSWIILTYPFKPSPQKAPYLYNEPEECNQINIFCNFVGPALVEANRLAHQLNNIRFPGSINPPEDW